MDDADAGGIVLTGTNDHDDHRQRSRLPRAVAFLAAALLAACGSTDTGHTVEASLRKVPSGSATLAVQPFDLSSGARDRRSVPERQATTPFAMNLYRDGDFVPQYTFEWCVAASMQMTLNMIEDPNRTSREDQGALWSKARSRSSDEWGGASGRGWSAVLNEMGVGPYELTSFPAYEQALREAAIAIRTTERPVGLIMWRGRHAWMMSGFESLGDPAHDADFVVTGIHVLDPLYPHGDDVWGPSPEPNALLTPDELARQFVARDVRSWTSDSPTGFVMIMPRADVTDGA